MAVECPVDIDTVKLYLRVDSDDENDLVNLLMLSATEFAENFQARTFVSRTRVYQLDKFPLIIQPPYPPLVSVDSIKYIDTGGDEQTLDTDYYRVDTVSEPGRITEAYGYSWPSIRDVTGAVTVTYTSGYGLAEDVPNDIKAEVMQIIKYMYERGGDIEMLKDANFMMWMRKMVNI